MWAYLESENLCVLKKDANLYQYPDMVSMESIVCALFLRHDEGGKEVLVLTCYMLDHHGPNCEQMTWA
jgi:hypothetical protein